MYIYIHMLALAYHTALCSVFVEREGGKGLSVLPARHHFNICGLVLHSAARLLCRVQYSSMPSFRVLLDALSI